MVVGKRFTCAFKLLNLWTPPFPTLGCDSVASRVTEFLCGQSQTPGEFGGKFSREFSWSTKGKLFYHFLVCMQWEGLLAVTASAVPPPHPCCLLSTAFLVPPPQSRASPGSQWDIAEMRTCDLERLACASLSLKQSLGGQSVPYGEVPQARHWGSHLRNVLAPVRPAGDCHSWLTSLWPQRDPQALRTHLRYSPTSNPESPWDDECRWLV